MTWTCSEIWWTNGIPLSKLEKYCQKYGIELWSPLHTPYKSNVFLQVKHGWKWQLWAATFSQWNYWKWPLHNLLESLIQHLLNIQYKHLCAFKHSKLIVLFVLIYLSINWEMVVREQGIDCEGGNIIVYSFPPLKWWVFSDDAIMWNWQNLIQEPRTKPSIIGTSFMNLGEFVLCGKDAKQSTKIPVSCCIGGVTTETIFCVRLSSFCHSIWFLPKNLLFA